MAGGGGVGGGEDGASNDSTLGLLVTINSLVVRLLSGRVPKLTAEQTSYLNTHRYAYSRICPQIHLPVETASHQAFYRWSVLGLRFGLLILSSYPVRTLVLRVEDDLFLRVAC